MKLTKVIIAGSAIPAITVPLTTLTSCAQVWGYKTPFTIGSIFQDDVNNPYYQFINKTYYDIDHKNIPSYLQSNYSIQTKSNQFYSYSFPKQFKDDEEKKQSELNQWVDGNAGWYMSSDSALASSAADKYKDEEGNIKSEAVYNAQNSTLSANTDFIATIANSVNAYLSYALQYQASQVNEKDKPGDNIAIAWGDNPGGTIRFNFQHGQKGIESLKEQNNQFFEYLFALSNLIGGKDVDALLKTSTVNFQFAGKFPIPSYKFDGDTKTNVSDDFIHLLEGNSGAIGSAGNYWTSRSAMQSIKEDDVEYPYRTYTYSSVPVLVRFANMTQTYVDVSKKTDSFLVNDFYSTAEQINEAIGNAWRAKLPLFTDIKSDDATPTYKTFKLDTNGLNTKQVNRDIYHHDLRLDDYESITGRDFIVLISYSVNVFEDEDGKNPHYERNTGIINSVENIFPAYFLDLSNDLYKPSHDESETYIFDQKKVNKLNNDLLGLLKRTSKEGRIADINKLSDESKTYLTFLGYVFSDEGEVNTAKFLKPLDKMK